MSDKAQKPLIPAATIMLLRDGPNGLEVFMVVRHHQIDFASGALVFPGGKVDPRDTEAVVRARTVGADAMDDWLLSMRVAAIREAYEECGVLLARPRGEKPLVDAGRLTDLEIWRDRLNKNEAGIGEMLEKEDLVLAADTLTPFAHWITPKMMPKRFDTHFFLAHAPQDHVLAHDGHESVDSVWIRPGEAIADAEQGRRTVIFPTRMNLSKLSRATSVLAALDMATSAPIVTVEPWIEERGDQGPMLCIPEEADYGLTAAPLEMAR